MKTRRFQPAGPGGFLLLEALLAVLILSVIAVSLTRAIHHLGQSSAESRREMSTMRTLNSILTRELRQPLILPGTRIYPHTGQADEYGVRYQAVVEEMTGQMEMRTREGQPLPEMFRIRIVASWPQGREVQTETVETYRYARLYRNNQGGGVPVAGQLPTGRPGQGGPGGGGQGGGRPGGGAGPGGGGGGNPGGGGRGR